MTLWTISLEFTLFHQTNTKNYNRVHERKLQHSQQGNWDGIIWYLLASYRHPCLKMDWCTDALRVIWVFCWNSLQSNMTCHRLFVVDCDFIIVWHAIWSKPSTLAGVCHTWSDIFNHKWSPDHSWFWCSWKQGIHKADRATHKSWEVHMEWYAVCSPLHPKLHFMQIQQEKAKTGQ